MSILKVAHMGHPVLREKAKPIERAAIATPSVQQLIDDMIETMREYHGIGLAAPQVHESVRIFVAGLEKEDKRTGETEIVPIAVVNPEITALGRDLVEDWEGCLSIPDIRGKVPGIGAFACGASAATARRSTWSSRTSRRASSSTRTTT